MAIGRPFVPIVLEESVREELEPLARSRSLCHPLLGELRSCSWAMIQALDRTQPRLPMGHGYLEGLTHDHVRHGRTLFAALDIAPGRVLTRSTALLRHQESQRFLKEMELNVPANLDAHVVVDNYGTHKQREVRHWLAVRPRFDGH